jgi:hypothetical protein
MCSELHGTYEYYNRIFPEVLQSIHSVIDFLLPSLMISNLYLTFCTPADHELVRAYHIECIRDIRRTGSVSNRPLEGRQRTTTNDENDVALLAKIASKSTKISEK